MEIISTESINVRYSDLDFDQSLKPYSLLNYFQDLASDNAEQLGFGYSFIHPKNLMWVLLKYRIEFTKYPSGLDNLTLKTEPRGYNKLFAYRNFELSSKNEVLAHASSMWSLVNFKDMTLANVENSIQSPYWGKFIADERDLSFEKIPAIKNIDTQKEFEVRYNDIDVNHHANNGNYIIWALEPLNYDFRINHKLKTIDMIFKKEIKLGEKLITQVEFISNNITVHALRHAETNEDLCLLRCEWI